jgi:putative pyruvate formate lyase activating enzyme
MKCYLCPRRCGVDRVYSRGFCGAGELPVIARAAAHYWEEPCISGKQGSGTVFFSGCGLRCGFCQNREISFKIKGRELDAKQLREVFLRLADTGVHNLNLVTPTPYILTIAEALEKPISIPVVYNCGGYESTEALRLLEGKIDIYLPDMKYADNKLALSLSKAPDYFDRAKEAVNEMYRQTGRYTLDSEGIMRRGVIVRHLVLPGELENSKDVLDWFAGAFRKGEVMLSLMSQYTPVKITGLPENLNRRLTDVEYGEVVDYLYMLGIKDGYIQDLDSSNEGFVPDFDLTGVKQ